MTSAELHDFVYRGLGVAPSNPRNFTPARVLSAITQAERIFAFLTLCLERTATFPILASADGWLAIPSTSADWIVPLRVELAGARLTHSTLREQFAYNPYWQGGQGTPAEYLVAGPKLLRVIPRPAGDVTLTIPYAHTPAQMALGTDVPQIREIYHRLLGDFAIARCRLRDGAQMMAKDLDRFSAFFEGAKEEAEIVRARSIARRYDVLPAEDWWNSLEKGAAWSIPAR